MVSLLEKGLYRMFNGKRTINSTIFLKEFEEENTQLKELIELSKKVSGECKEKIHKDILLLKEGLKGEQNVYFQIKNSFIPMLALHDIRLEYEKYTAQFDFILITKKCIYVLETKKLSGNIEINEDGDFIRTKQGKFYKEGMESPITQNERHINMLKEILRKENLVNNFPIKSLVVIANPKTIIKKAECPKHIKDIVVKYDQLNSILKKDFEDASIERDLLEKYLYNIANFLIANNKVTMYDYKAKYLIDKDCISNNEIENKDIQHNDNSECKIHDCEKNMDIQESNNESKRFKAPIIENVKEVIEEEKLSKKADKKEEIETKGQVNNYNLVYSNLKQYRYNKAKEEKIQPYMIFNNEVLEQIIKNNPKSKEELLTIKGIGKVKVDK
ncbi:NERD domain-containing protein [Clostridium sp. ZBS17]|uniref:NERD domain-containing protein n=1 Tax=Clostridium sp. ZBS17 TaxID=2949968 RepID=UPI00207AC04B|nr:NERD domain-containing protein [Clostridium sp. ZBS17]